MQHKLELPFHSNNDLEFGLEWTLIQASDKDCDKKIVQARKKLEEIQDKNDEESLKIYPELLTTLARAYLEKFYNDNDVPPSFNGNNNLIVLACAILGLKSRLGDKATFHRLASTACSNLYQLHCEHKIKIWPQTLENLFPTIFPNNQTAKNYCQNMLMVSADRHQRCAALN